MDDVSLEKERLFLRIHETGLMKDLLMGSELLRAIGTGPEVRTLWQDYSLPYIRKSIDAPANPKTVQQALVDRYNSILGKKKNG